MGTQPPDWPLAGKTWECGSVLLGLGRACTSRCSVKERDGEVCQDMKEGKHHGDKEALVLFVGGGRVLLLLHGHLHQEEHAGQIPELRLLVKQPD